jgi:hypothetical protein
MKKREGKTPFHRFQRMGKGLFDVFSRKNHEIYVLQAQNQTS